MACQHFNKFIALLVNRDLLRDLYVRGDLKEYLEARAIKWLFSLATE